MRSVLFDLRQAAKSLTRSPTFTVAGITTLAVGIAGVVVMSALVKTVLLSDPPYPEANRIVLVGDQAGEDQAGNTGYATFADWRERSTSFDRLAIVTSWAPTLIENNEAERLTGLRMSVGGFETLGARAALGRLFGINDDDPDHRRVVVLTDALWRSRFDADPDIVGRSLDMAGTEYQVIGVLDPGFKPQLAIHLYTAAAEIYAPLGYRSEQPWACRSCQHLKVFGRLAPNTTLDQASADLSAIQADLFEKFPRDYDHPEIAILPLRGALVSSARPVLMAVLAAVFAVLLIACANVASLQLARATRRRSELAVRSALGADRGRILQQVLTESMLLWALGSGLGLALSLALIPLVDRLIPAVLLPAGGLALEVPVLIGTLSATLLVSLTFSLLPALGVARRAGVAPTGGSRWSTDGTSAGRRTLVVVNVALAFALVAGSALMLKSVERLLATDPGFDPQRVAIANLSFLGDRYERDDVAVGAYEQIIERLEASPGVEAAAITSQIPLGGNYDGWGVDVEGRITGRAEDEVDLQRYSVTDDYLRVLKIPLLRGRWFEDEDISTAPKVVLISQSAESKIAPNGDALGQRIRFGNGEDWYTIVGVVGDVRHEELGGQTLSSVYLNQRQWTDRYVTLAVRTSGYGASPQPIDLSAAIHAAVAEFAPAVPIFGEAQLDHLAADTAARQRFTSTILGGFSLVALFLAAIGLYGVVAYLVERQTREIGLRVALGAVRSQIAGWVFRQGFLLVGTGLLLGALLAVASNRLLTSLLYGIELYDPRTYLETLGVLIAIALLAHAAPLVRALRVDPMTVLRRD